MVKPKLLDQVRMAIRVRHLSYRTEQAYVDWIRRFILFHNKRHPNEMDETYVSRFLTYLAVKKNVAASTQNQALSAILFLYRHVLKRELGWVDNVERAKKPSRLPVVGFFEARGKGDLGAVGGFKMAYGESVIRRRPEVDGMSAA